MGDLEPTSGRLPDPQGISEAERQQLVVALRGHTTEGRLTLDEFSDRVGEVFAARTRSEAYAALRDLPAMAAPVPEASRRRTTRWAVAILGGHTQRSRWRPAEDMTAVAFMGGCELDFRQAELDGPEVLISAVAIMGGVDILVPEGIEVELTGFAFLGGKEAKVRGRRIPGAPIVRVRAFAFMGGVTVRTKSTKSQQGAETVERLASGAAKAIERKRERDQQVAANLERHARRLEEQAERHRRRAGRYAADRPSARIGQELKGLALEMAEDALRGVRQPDSPVRRMPTAPDGTVTVLFSDIEGYTMLTERLGDVEAQKVLKAHNGIVRACLAEGDGFEVKSQGDGFMVAFASARKALHCAIRIQREIEAWSLDHPTEELRVRMGLHTGEALLEDGDFTGRTVILASRIAAQAGGGEIVVSSVVKELTESMGEFDFDDGRQVELKGLSQPYRVHTVLW